MSMPCKNVFPGFVSTIQSSSDALEAALFPLGCHLSCVNGSMQSFGLLVPVPTSVEHFEQVGHEAQLEDLGTTACNVLGRLLA